MESQTPPGSQPPTKQEPSKSDAVWISPRLREKLDESESEAPRQGGSPMLGILLAVLVIGGGIGLVAAMRSGAAREKAAAERRAQAAAAAATADSMRAAAQADSMRLARADTSGHASAPAGTGTRPQAKPAAAASSRPASTAGGSRASTVTSHAAPPAASAASAAVPAQPAERGPFGLDVGTYLAEERATTEEARLATATGLAGKVVTRNEDGGDVYHVVLGSFATRAAAERKAETLVAKGLVNQARTVSLAP